MGVSAAVELVQRPAWWASAACLGRTAVMFAEDRVGQARAVAICAGCPVKAECLADAQVSEVVPYQASGVRGGLLPEQRGRRPR